MSDRESPQIIIIESENKENNIAFGFLCPKCHDFYAFGFYYLGSTNGKIVAYEKRTTCMNCGENRLINPVIFNSMREYGIFCTELSKGEHDLVLFEDIYVYVCDVDMNEYSAHLSSCFLFS